MAKYSFTQYGIPKYGEIENNRVYYNVGLRAWSYDYNTISLVWSSVVSDPADPLPTHWKLIKSFSGAPNNPYDGILVDGDVITSYRLSKIDEQEVSVATEVNYSFWVFNGSKWVECGNVNTILIPATDTLNRISKWIPKVWLNESGGIGDSVGESEDGYLNKTLSAYAFEYDRFRAEADLLYKGSDYRYLPNVLLKNNITDLGFSYEPALGDLYHRALYKSGHIINGLKGTKTAVQNYTTSLTHWPAQVTLGQNLFLDYNDSSFEESIGRWGKALVNSNGGGTTANVSAMTLTHQKYATSLTDLGVAVTAPTPVVYDVLFPPRSKGFMVYKGSAATYSQASWLRLPDKSLAVPGRDIKYAVPVTPGKRYIFTGWARSKNARPTSGATYLAPALNNTVCYTSILFYDKDNNFIEQSGFGAPLYYTNTWKEFTSGRTDSSVSYQDRRGHLAPANAAYAAVEFYADTDHVLGGIYFDMFQITEAGLNSLEFQDARKVIVTVSGTKENYLANPSFDYGTAGWFALNSNLIQDLNPPAAAKVYGNAVAKLVATSDDRVGLVSDWIPVTPGQNYTFSIHASGAPRNAKVRIEYSVQQNEDEKSAVVTDETGSYYEIDPYIVESSTTLLTGTAQRLYVSSVAPAYSIDSGTPLVKVSVYSDDAVIGDTFYFDAALLEQTSELDAFFDGSGAPTPVNPIVDNFYAPEDCLWEVRNRFNFVSNPSLETTTGWTAGTGSTLTSASDVTPLYGNKHGKVSKAGGGSVTTTVYLPKAAVGGEDMTISAYVRNKAGVYSISTTNQAIGFHTVEDANKDSWVRIHVNRILLAGETSFDVTISLSTGNASAAVFYFDGVQAEYGRIATRFIDPADAGTSTIANFLNSSVNMYSSRLESIGGGVSNYWPTYADKFTRLASTLNLVMPHGSSWSVQPGSAIAEFPDIDKSLIPSASFERDLGFWQGISANLYRSVVRGSLFDELCTHGTAYCRVQSTGTGTFGIKTDKLPIGKIAGYYSSVAVKPENVDAYGEYKLSIQFFDEYDIQVVEKSTTVQIDQDTRWAYLSAYATSVETNGSAYAVLKVECTTYAPAAGQVFHVDRAVFRE